MNRAQTNTRKSENARPPVKAGSGMDILDNLDQAVDVLSTLWLALNCNEGWFDGKTNGRFSSVLHMAIDQLTAVQDLINDHNGRSLVEYSQSMLKSDPIVAAIWNYTNGVACYDSVEEADYEASGGEDLLISKTYGPPMAVLDNWTAPAVTAKGAIEALRFALAEGEISRTLEPRVENMIRAAYDFYKVEGGAA